MNALGYECTPQIVKQILDEIDEDGSGVIEVDEFIEFMSKHMVVQSMTVVGYRQSEKTNDQSFCLLR